MVDPIFGHPRLAAVYDALDGDRSDLDAYVAIVDELGARSVLDLGCGTGTLACLLAGRGLRVVGVDPAVASIEVARSKPGADAVRWIVGDAMAVPPTTTVDLVTMTGNVAQVLLTDESWAATLDACHRALRDGGALVFETRDPARRAWTAWNRDASRRVVDGVEAWVDVLGVHLPFVSFRWTYRFGADGAELLSDSTLRFRTRDEVEASLRAAGFAVREVRDAPDRPGKELVFLAHKPVEWC